MTGNESVIQRITLSDAITVPVRDSFGVRTTLRIGGDDDYEVAWVKASGPGWVDVERDVKVPSDGQ